METTLTPTVEESYPAHNKAINAYGECVSSEINYIVFDATDEDKALKAVLSYAPKEMSGAELSKIEINERLEETTFSVIATYDSNQSQQSTKEEDDEESTLSFSCGGGSAHMTVAYSQQCILDGGINPGLAIGWNGKTKSDEMEIAGVDVPAPEFRETYTKRMNVSKLTTAYRKKVGNLVGKVNNSSFKGWQAGEVMFTNISFSANDKSNKVIVTFEFAIRPNEKTTLWGHDVPKKGYDYLWTIPCEKVENGIPVVKPRAIFKAQVVQYADFSVLGV